MVLRGSCGGGLVPSIAVGEGGLLRSNWIMMVVILLMDDCIDGFII